MDNMDGARSKTSGVLQARRASGAGNRSDRRCKRNQASPQSSWNPFPVTTSNNDPVVRELARLAQSDAQSQFSNAE